MAVARLLLSLQAASAMPVLIADALAGITCAASHTPCAEHFSRSGQGCCVYQDAVCCEDKHTCCPAGTTCQLQNTSSGGTPVPGKPSHAATLCVDAKSKQQLAKAVCKPGAQAMATGRKNVIVLGDSVSIGYTPPLNNNLSDVAAVHHAPYDNRDGGAEETAYGLQCLDYFTQGSDGQLLVPEVFVFNFGLHDGPLGNATLPGAQGNSSVYASELEQIVVRLKGIYKGTKTQLLFALTSPMLCNAIDDGNVMALNNAATAIMTRHGVPTVDPHSAIVEKCGPVPQATCFGKDKCFCPHCPGEGYVWLAENVYAPAIRGMLVEHVV